MYFPYIVDTSISHQHHQPGVKATLNSRHYLHLRSQCFDFLAKICRKPDNRSTPNVKTNTDHEGVKVGTTFAWL